jgi:hypothetical protein
MSEIYRRHFIQFAGSTLATLSLSQWDVINKSNRYAQVLAEDTPRKLALLVGINQYPNSDRFDNLAGCVTDVDLQQYLLIHRFGFNPKNIIRLTSDETPDKQPTRKNILTAFEEHLIKQAQPEDVVVFHFSGHGSRLSEQNIIQNCSNPLVSDGINSTLVPADDGENGISFDIMGRTLFLLMLALKTENVTAILDSCYSGGGTRGNFRVRSVSGEGLQLTSEEITYQQSWIEKLKLTPEQLTRRRCAAVAKGVIFASAQPDQQALDADLGDFAAGAFTYLMTQYLWQQTNTIERAIAEISRAIKPISSQVPLADGRLNQPVYFLTSNIPAIDAVIIEVVGSKAIVWLGGVEKESLEAFQTGATFTIINQRAEALGKVELISERKGLMAEAKLIENRGNLTLKPGMWLQESSRVIPANLKLYLGLDSSLKADLNLAQQKLSTINRVEVLPQQPGNNPYPGGVQYIFSRMTEEYQQILQQQAEVNLPAVGSLGLFTSSLELIPESFNEIGETINEAIERLEPKLKSLLATRIIKKTLNASSSELDVEVSMQLVEQPNQILARTATKTARNNRGQSQQNYSHQLPVNQLFQFQVKNHENSPLYLTTLLIDSTGGLIVIFPYYWPATEASMRLEPNQTLSIGDPEELKLKAIEKGTGEALVIVSRLPLKKAVKTLVSLATELNRSQGAIALKEPVEVIGDLLDDLSGDRSPGGFAVKPISVSDLATLSITFEVG